MKERYTKHLAPAQKAKPPPASLSNLKKESGLTARFDLTAASRAKLKPGNIQTAVLEAGKPSGSSRLSSDGGQKESERAAAVKEPSAGPGERQGGHVGPSHLSHGVANAKAAAQVPAFNETVQLEQGAQLPTLPVPEKVHGIPPPVPQPSKLASQVPPSSAGPSGQAPQPSRDRSRTPPSPAMLPQERRSAQLPLGAAALSAPGKAPISETVRPDQNLQTPGTVAAGQQLLNQHELARQEIGREASPFPSQQPFTRLPDSNFVVPEPPPEAWDSSQREGGAEFGVNASRVHHDQGAVQREPSMQEHLESIKGMPSGQIRGETRFAGTKHLESIKGMPSAQIGEETGLAGRKHPRDESTAPALGAAQNGKKQRSSAQEFVVREGLAKSPPGRTSSAELMEALEKERSEETRGVAAEAKPTEELKGDARLQGEQGASGHPSEECTAVDKSEGASNRRPGAGGGLALPETSGEHAEISQGGQHRSGGDGEDGPEGGRLKGKVAGAASIAGRMAGEQPDDDGVRESLSKKLEESRRRRLRKVNGELVGGPTEPRMEPPVDRTSDIPRERVSEIRAWVAAFMREYGCSQDNVIKALIEASGEFEAARPLLDRRVAGAVKGPVWTLREDHVLLTHPVSEKDTHPAFLNLRDVFGQDAVERRLKFLGRLD